VQTAGTAELEVTPDRRRWGGARCAGGMGGGVQESSAAERGFAGFWSSVPAGFFLQAFPCIQRAT